MNSHTPTTPHLHRVDADGLTMACYEWRPERRGQTPTLLCVHATGFHARVWDQTLAHLPPWHVVCVDLRGHGRSDKTEIIGWAPFGRDLAALVRTLDLRRLHGVGHSMGAHGLVQAAAYEPERFERLTLIDPVIASPSAYHAPLPTFPGGMHPAARRRSRFDSVEEMLGRFASRMPYSLFTPEVLRDYCEHGVLPAPDGQGVELACSPVTEATVYMTGRANASIYASIRALQIPVQVVRAKQPTPDRDPFDYSYSPTWPELAGEFRHGQDVYLPERSHFLPMEDPRHTAQLIEQFSQS
jgi:pimeloyl-ACP methyl ester carboxylesterase